MPDLKSAFKRSTPGLSAKDESDSDHTLSSGDATDEQNAEKYLLRVTAGPSYDPSTHQTVNVNGQNATNIESDAMGVQIRVRIKDYNGLPRGSPETSSYFSDSAHSKSLYSISFSFVPKKTIPSTDLVWGNDFDHPLRERLPPGFNTAFRIVKNLIDPGLECDAYADQPWLYGPALSCWFALHVGDDGLVKARSKEMADDKGIIVEGGSGSGLGQRAQLGLPDDPEKRRKCFLDRKNRAKFDFEKGRLYQGDFHNPYLDFSNYGLKLPGFSLSVLRYIGDKTHTLRYVFKNRSSGEVYFVVVFTLLFGKQMKEAVKQEERASADGG